MRILVTGVTGFVGSAIARKLIRHGHSVVGLVRDLERGSALAPVGVELTVGDMAIPESYGPLVAGVDAVVHAAQATATGRWSRRAIATLHRADALMTRTLARACLKHDKALIYTSGALVRGNRSQEWIDEASPLQPCRLAQGHAEMEAELNRWHRERGLRVIIISPGFVYGPGGFLRQTVEMLLAEKYWVIGNPCNYWGMVHVDDLADVYLRAFERGMPGTTYFVSDGMPLRRREVIDVVTDTLKMHRVGRVPSWIAAAVLGFPLVEAVTTSLRMRSDRVRSELGWMPEYWSFREGLPMALRAMGHMQR